MTGRNAELAKIHVGRKLLRLDEETYRDLLEAETGQRSAAGLDAAQLRAVLARMRHDGARFHPRRGTARLVPREDIATLIRKIDALCINHPTGRKPRAWAEGVLQRMAAHPHRPPLEWADAAQLRKLIQALEIDARRRAPAGGIP